MAGLLKAEGVEKSYTIAKTTLPVLRGATLAVEQGETVAIVGISGAGKSTLLHILGGLDSPDGGRVLLNDRSLYDLPGGHRARIRGTTFGFVFQSYHLLPEMDVVENVMLPALAQSGAAISRAGLRERALELLRSVGLAERAGHTPLELSGGEQQRVALARALMNDPGIVLADEPTGNLDDATGGQVLDYLFSLTRERGHSLVVVTHNEQLAKSCDRMLHLTDGVIV